MVCENDYFRTRTFWQHENIKPLSLREIQDVLNFLHEHADRLPITLRTLNAIARERKNRPDIWEIECRGMFRTPIGFAAARAPVVLGYRQREPKLEPPSEPENPTTHLPASGPSIDWGIMPP
jgi:hypothetical protein